MKKQFNSWDEHLAQRLQQLKPEPALDAWDRIEAALDEKPKRGWIWMAASTTLLAGAAGLLLWQLNLAQPEEMISANKAGLQDNRPGASERFIISDTQQLPATDSALQHAQGQAAAIDVAAADASTKQAGRLLPARSSAATASPKPHTIAADARHVQQGVMASAGIKLPSQEGNMHSLHSERLESLLPLMPAVTASLSAGALPAASSVAPKNKLSNFKVQVKFIPEHIFAMAGVAAKKDEKEKAGSTSLWAEAMPTWSLARMEPNTTHGMNRVVFANINEPAANSGERMGGQLATGISVPVAKNLHWKSGVYYWYQQQRLTYSYYNSTPDAYVPSTSEDGQFNMSPVYYEQSNSIDLELHNVGLSTGIQYKLPKLLFNSMVESRLQAHYNNHEQLSSLLSFGYSVLAKLDDKLRLHIGPSVQLQLNNNQHISPHFTEKPLSLGLQMGLSFKN